MENLKVSLLAEVKVGLKKICVQCTYVYTSIVNNSWKIKTTQKPINGWMDKEDMVYPCNGILFSLLEQRKSDGGSNVDEPWRHHAEWNKPVIKKDK
jgi:hypothetical protein